MADAPRALAERLANQKPCLISNHDGPYEFCPACAEAIFRSDPEIRRLVDRALVTVRILKPYCDKGCNTTPCHVCKLEAALARWTETREDTPGGEHGR